MKSIHACKSSFAEAFYSLNKERGYISLCCYNLINHGEIDEKHDVYYRDKYLYLKDKCLDDKKKDTFDGKIAPYLVENLIANSHQLVFEVTDNCNLSCKYCGYSELYEDYDIREMKMLRLSLAKKMIDYLCDLWSEYKHSSTQNTFFISFYGGEPLMNIKLIKDIINYVESLNIKNKQINFTMTTNAMLLDKYMDYLVEKGFKLLISLDGNEQNNGYRLTKNNKESFSVVHRNIKALKDKYPDYFETNVNFNSVLHNKNNVSTVIAYIQNEFGKTPSLGELNRTGIKPEKRAEFDNMFASVDYHISTAPNREELEKELFIKSPAYSDATTFIHQYNSFIYKSYNSFFTKKRSTKYIPTGTCMPFSRKIFVTVNGKILPCERIGQQFGLGYVDDKGVHLNSKEIADKYNQYFSKFSYCGSCYNAKSCKQCMFCLDDLDNEQVRCPGYMSEKDFTRYMADNISFIEKHRDEYTKMLNVYFE